MNPLNAPMFVPGDPLAGMISFGSCALIGWILLSACVGMFLALLRERAGGAAGAATAGSAPHGDDVHPHDAVRHAA